MFKIFSTAKNRFLGVDLGTSSIKAVEITIRHHKPCVTNYGWVSLDFMAQKHDYKSTSYPVHVKRSLMALLKSMDSKAEDVYVSMAGFSGLVTLIEFPAMKEEELAQAISFEARKYIPSSLDEVNMSWEVVASESVSMEKDVQNTEHAQQGQREKIRVLLVAAPKEEVARYEGFFDETGLHIGALELETFSLVRSLIGNDKGSFLVIDIGAKATNIVYVKDGVVHINRNIDTGGSNITEAIAEGMNISHERADAYKKEGKNFFESKEATLVFPGLQSVINEAERILGPLKTSKVLITVDQVILSGGTAKLAGLDKYVSKKLGIETRIGNPWGRVVYDEKLTPVIKRIGTSFSVALGLALRGVDDAA